MELGLGRLELAGRQQEQGCKLGLERRLELEQVCIQLEQVCRQLGLGHKQGRGRKLGQGRMLGKGLCKLAPLGTGPHPRT